MQLRNLKIVYIQTFSRQHQTYKTIQVKISYILSFTISYIDLSAFHLKTVKKIVGLERPFLLKGCFLCRDYNQTFKWFKFISHRVVKCCASC